MSWHLLGLPYPALQAILYPHPPYKTFTLMKRNGSPRVIHEPRLRLKVLQEKVLAFLYERASPAKPCVHGFTRKGTKRSIVTNAKAHCSPKTQHLLNIDIEDFFPSITFYRVRGVLQKKPFMCSYQVATVLAHLCTFNGILPQGAPTSPFLANLVCRTMDSDLMDLAKRHRATYTRYADDLTFSFSARRAESLPANICRFDSGILTLGHELQALIEHHNFRINPNKSRLSSRMHRLEVTGITINEFPNVKRLFVDRIRGALHAWDVHGYDLAQAAWEMRVKNAASGLYEKRPWKRQTRGGVPALKNVLWGKLLYLRMVRGADDALYSRLAERYNELCAREKAAGTFVGSSLPIEPIVRNADQAAKAVFVVEWGGTHEGKFVCYLGTAFAYKDVGLITCEHVIKHGEDGPYADEIHDAEISVTNAVTGESWPVKIVHRDKDRDLAVLQFDAPDPPAHWHFIDSGKPIALGERGVLIGFPNWTNGRPANQVNAQVVNVFPRAGLKRFEIKESIRKGNSGGPFVDDDYRIVGVAQQGAEQGKGNDECLCVTELRNWVDASKAAKVPVAVPTGPAAPTSAFAPTVVSVATTASPSSADETAMAIIPAVSVAAPDEPEAPDARDAGPVSE